MHLRMPVLKLSRRTRRILAGITLTLLVLAALSAWLVPKAVHHALTKNVAELLGRQVDVGEIRFNPFTLALSAQNLVIAQPQSAPLLKIDEIDLRVAWRSIVLFAPVLDRLRIAQPQVALSRQDATHFNFSDIVERFASTSAGHPDNGTPASTGVPRFSLNNLSLTGGVISLDDHVTGRQQTIDDLTLAIPSLSSLGFARKTDVQPTMHMRINGSPFDLSGTARPFDATPTFSLDATLDGLALDKWADFWPMPLPVQLKSAQLDSRLKILLELPPNTAPTIQVQGDAGLRQLDVTESSGSPLLTWDGLKVDGLAADVTARTVSIGAITLEKPHVEAHRDAHQLNWQRVANGFAKLAGPGHPPEKPTEPTPTRTSTNPASGSPAAPATPASAQPEAPSPAAPGWKIAIDTFRLDAGQAHLHDEPIGLDHTLNGLGAEIRHITLPQNADQPMLAQLSMGNQADGSSLQVQAPIVLQPLSIHAQVRLDKLTLAPFAAAIRHFAPVTLQDGRLTLEGKVEVADSRVEARDVKLGLRQFAARDDSVKPSVPLSIGTLDLVADRLALDAKPTNFTLQANGVQKHGTLALKGSLTVQPLSLKTSVDLGKFDAASLAPYFASRLNATVRSLSLGAHGNAAVTLAQNKPIQADWRGAIQVNDFDFQDRVNKAPFLNWKHLGLNDMQVSMSGSRLVLGLGHILLDNFYGNILLSSNARLNVMDVLVDKGQAAGSITQNTQTRRGHEGKQGKSAVRQVSAGPDISIASITLRRGRVTFNDHFVRPNYRAELSSIDGTLTAVSSTRPTPAKVRVSGRVYGTAPLTISGTVQPFSRYLALDLKASAKGVDLPRFTTYSSKYVGYAIERGKLSVDLQYQIKNRALQASNKVLLNQLTFGKPSGSPDAIKLPVLLAVALLKDSSGNIDINLPISGSLDDPQFSVGGIIVRVILNTLAKAVTAPFKLLASAFGGGSEDLSRVDFAPGSATLDDTAKSNIATLVKALSDRPSLKMDIIGRADPQADEEGLRQAWVDDQMRAAKARDTSGRGKKTDPGSVSLTDADRAKYLEKVYSNTKIKDKPRNAIGFAKSLPPEQMNTLLLAAAPVGKQALDALAEARAQAVYEQLLTTAQDLTDRIFIVAPKIGAADANDGGSATSVDFALH
ncbi:DUF748 domain-containing protein [Castellaniella sp. MT123]|uniref:DUF748 domain-containing protein n=1 Tax=Castellaniella sp. MT123 TaxID=3140381 RepID=UPI0031F3EF3F